MTAVVDPPVLVPAAGRGTRLRPATRYLSKPMLPVGNRPLIDFVFEEIEAAGCSRTVVIVDPEDLQLQDYISRQDPAFKVHVVEQPRPLGLGDALLQGAAELENFDHFAFALPDNVVLNGEGLGSILPAPSANRLCFGMTRVTREEAPFFGNSGLFETPGKLPPREKWIEVTELKRKGSGRFIRNPGPWPRWRIIPRGILPPRFFELAAELEPDPGSLELDDVPIYRRLLSQKPALARPVEGNIFDTGTPESFLRFCSRYYENQY